MKKVIRKMVGCIYWLNSGREKGESKKRSCIIALTAHSVQEVRDKCFAAGMDDFANKPIEADTLQKLITKFCE